MKERSRQRAEALEHEALKPTVEVERSSASAMAAEQEQVDTVVVKETTVTASAREQSPSEQPYVSALANTRMKSERSQKIVDAVAVWEPEAVAALERGERLDESTIPHGIGPKFLESQGPGLHPEVRAQLQARELKKDQIRILYTQIHEIREKRVELGQPANESQWKLWGEVETERIREDTRVSRRARLQSELADGFYEPNTAADTAEVGRQQKALSDVTAQTEQRKDAYLARLYAKNPELKPDSLRSRLRCRALGPASAPWTNNLRYGMDSICCRFNNGDFLIRRRNHDPADGQAIYYRPDQQRNGYCQRQLCRDRRYTPEEPIHPVRSRWL